MSPKSKKNESPFVWKVFIPVMAFAFLFGGLSLLINTNYRLSVSSNNQATTPETVASFLPDADFTDIPVTNNCCNTGGGYPSCAPGDDEAWNRGWYDCDKGACDACDQSRNPQPPPSNGGDDDDDDDDNNRGRNPVTEDPVDPACTVNGVCGPGESHLNCPQDCDEQGSSTPGSGSNSGGGSGIVCTRPRGNYAPGDDIPIGSQNCYEMRCTFQNDCGCVPYRTNKIPGCVTQAERNAIISQQRAAQIDEGNTETITEAEARAAERRAEARRLENVQQAMGDPSDSAAATAVLALSTNINNLLGIELTTVNPNKYDRAENNQLILQCTLWGTAVTTDNGQYVECLADSTGATNANGENNNAGPCAGAGGIWLVTNALSGEGVCSGLTSAQCVSASGTPLLLNNDLVCAGLGN